MRNVRALALLVEFLELRPIQSISGSVMKIIRALLASLVTLAALPALAQAELVLNDKVQLKVKGGPSGSLFIVTSPNFGRTYRWGGCTLNSHMAPRASRWFGSLGIYDPAPAGGGRRESESSDPNCHGISRTVVEEGQIHFASESAALTWLNQYAKLPASTWSEDGLVLSWNVTPSRAQLRVELWQICIAGHRPTSLAGASKDSLQIRRLEGLGPTRPPCAVVDVSVLEETQRVWRQHWKEAREAGRVAPAASQLPRSAITNGRP